MEALQRELTKYFRDRIDMAMKEEIANRATTEWKLHEIYACYLPHDNIYEGEDPLQRAIIKAINEVIEEWYINDYDVAPFCKDDCYGVYWS
jgi:hypothetical protein